MPSRLLVAVFAGLFQLTLGFVFIEQAEEGVFACRGMAASVKCTTTTKNGFLSWRNNQEMSFAFDKTTSVGTNKPVGSTKMTLDSVDPVSNAVVYTSTATENNILENKTIQCSDGEESKSIDIYIKSPSSPSWAHSPCMFSQGSVWLSWNAPSLAPECCEYYKLQLSTGSLFITETSVTVPIRQDEEITATVHCVDHGGDIVTKTPEMTINTNISIERVTMEPLNVSCDANATYKISPVLLESKSLYKEICTPPITKSIVSCTTSSTHQTSDPDQQTAIFSVPAIETIDATVTITNAAGVTVSQSASAVALAQACQELNKADKSFMYYITLLLSDDVVAILIVLGIAFFISILCSY